jgi:nucleoside-diphosphate-sugar epimerase
MNIDMQNESEIAFTIIGCGYVGKKLIHKLISKQLTRTEAIRAIVSSEQSRQSLAQQGIEAAAVDLDQKPLNWPASFSLHNSLLFYFAPPPSQGTEDTRTENFLHYLSQTAIINIKKVVLISTTGVYGNCQGDWIDETQALNPSADRAKRRVHSEQQFQGFCQAHGIPLVILRVAGIYGPDKLPLQRIKAQAPIVRKEDSPFTNRIHVHDLTDICIKAALTSNIEGIFNCADGHPSTMYDYFVKVAEVHNLPKPPAISLHEAQSRLSAGMLSYMEESRRIRNDKLLSTFNIELTYPDLNSGLKTD